MGSIELRRSGRLAYREAVPDGAQAGPPAVLVHGFPESSLMWEPLMARLAEHGIRSVAPDLYCLGDSEDPGPATFERNLDAFTALLDELALGRCAVVVHDWGGFIGLAWASSHPASVAALVISDTGFFADGKWHGMAQAVRGEHGEELVEALDRDGFAGLLRTGGAEFDESVIDAYWAPFATRRGRQATVEFYRSMEFSKLEPYQGRLGALGVPTLLLWGADDPFAPIAGAHRFEREIPGAALVAIEGAGHFVYDQASDLATATVVRFLLDSEPKGA